MQREWSIAGNVLVSRGEGHDAQAPDVLVLDTDEAAGIASDHATRDLLSQLPHAELSFVEHIGERAAGIVVAPAGERLSRRQGRFGVLLSRSELVLVDDGDVCTTLLGQLAEERVPVESPAGVLCAMLRLLLREHPATLSRVREDFERFEALILEGRTRIDRGDMMADARRLLGFDTFYQGLSDLADDLSEDEALLFPADCERFAALSRQLDRLGMRLESLQDYSLQVHSLYQESIDVRQNNVMQWLTVVATIALPLTFITGWFGMNFPNMLLINVPWGYAVAAALCVALAVAEIVFFHRRGWLSFGMSRRKRRGQHGTDRHR
ncbi:CorA family divalent cation transporter [Collinsella sp. An2]|uniref:CorA family divalent cation transporter n=1 Tax=Collinsella sp. An2 TaxID=1965585 RepID=UPI000B3AC8AF|nr:CorA family divalent cation transporter [Collinsella sp. An2]OUP11111.1 hypothetical protein B5F33_01680 [Collinsella sp. An2]